MISMIDGSDGKASACVGVMNRIESNRIECNTICCI